MNEKRQVKQKVTRQVEVCACGDCQWARRDPIGWRYMNHAGWHPHPDCGKVFETIEEVTYEWVDV